MKKSKKKIENTLPGYPHYSESEDIMNNEERADADVENLSRSHGGRNSDLKDYPPAERYKDATPEIVPGTEADLTGDDLFSLGPVDRDQDEREDETLLPSLKIGPDLSGDDLDVPGADLDDEAESRGSEDEENNYYSRGQD